MDPHLLKYYNEELIYMRESSSEFAQLHPKIARRLGMQGTEVADPYVERLIEAFCFMSARMRIKLDAEFPKFTQRLLEVIYPNYISPTPSMAVAQFHPNAQEGDFSKGFEIAKGTSLFAKIPKGEQTACEFRSGLPVKLWPIEIVSAKLGGVPPDVPSLDRYLPSHIQITGSLRLRLKCQGELKFKDLVGFDELPIHLCGDEQIASRLFELLHTSAVATLTGVTKAMGNNPYAVTKEALCHIGMGTDEGLLPLNWNSFHGHNLMHEYFACPEKFYFFNLKHLAAGFKRIDSDEAEILILLTRNPGDLEGLTDAKQFALFCTPIVNLFTRRSDRIEINQQQPEFHLLPDRSRPMDFEVYSVAELTAQQAQTTESLTFRPLYQTLNQDEGNFGRYFSVRRELRLPSDTSRKYGTRTSYTGTEVFISLVDQNEAPYPDSLRYVSIETWLTNRDLPRLVPRNGYSDLSVSDSIPVLAVGLIRPPSAPKPAFAQREHAWRLIRQLSFNYLPLADLPQREGAQALRDMLKLFVNNDDVNALRQIQNLIGSQITPITRRLPGTGPLIYGRGVQCQITVDEDGFSGVSPYLFGVVLEHYLSRHVAINMFTETELVSMQRGVIERWPVRMGTRNVI
jgi:type VI secretion system protein ImpG